MNRLKAMFFTLLLILVFTACEGNKEQDTTLPIFGPMVNKTIPYGNTFDPMEDVSANDNIDGDITFNVECIIYDSYGEESFDINVTDVYTQICTVSDYSGNTASTERSITIQDELIGAVISGVEDTTIGVGLYFDPMNGLEIIDKLDGNITEDVVIHIFYVDPVNEQVETVDTSSVRSYYIDYIIINSLDITTEFRIQVDVVDEDGPVIDASDIDTDNYMIYDLLDGVTATDEVDGDISEITYTIYDWVGNELEYTEYLYGTFYVEYEATDASGNVGTKRVELRISDLYPPDINIVNRNVFILPGDTINIENNVTYSDESDEYLTMYYEIENMDTSNIVTDLTNTDYGFYMVNVFVTDSGGETSESYFFLNITTGVMEYIDLDLFSVEDNLNEFYGNVKALFLSSEEVCDMYVTDVAFNVNITYQECVSGTNRIRAINSYQRINDTTYEVIDGITYYTSEVEIYRDFEHVFKDVTYHLVRYEYSWITHIVFDSDPFDIEYPISVYHPEFEMVDNNLMTFYSNMFNPSITDTTFCTMFVVEAIHNTMTLNECLDFVEGANNSVLQYSVNSFRAISIPFGDGPDLDGYEADIHIMKTGLEKDVTVQFIFFEQAEDQSIYFIDGFFGPSFDPDLKLINGTPTFREIEITEFYDALLDTSLSSTAFCETHYMISPVYDFELSDCISYVDDIRSNGVTYTINDITPTTLEAFNGTLLAYTLDITFLDDGIDQNLLIDFAILQKHDGNYPIFFDLYLVNLNYEKELNHAVIGFRAYPGIIQGFYDDVLDTGMSDSDFCSKYLLTGGAENLPLTSQECSDIRIDVIKGTYGFTVEGIIYQDIGDPQYPPVYSVDMLQNVFRDYKVDFTMYYNPLRELIIKVNFNDALGGGFE